MRNDNVFEEANYYCYISWRTITVHGVDVRESVMAQFETEARENQQRYRKS